MSAMFTPNIRQTSMQLIPLPTPLSHRPLFTPTHPSSASVPSLPTPIPTHPTPTICRPPHYSALIRLALRVPCLLAMRLRVGMAVRCVACQHALLLLPETHVFGLATLSSLRSRRLQQVGAGRACTRWAHVGHAWEVGAAGGPDPGQEQASGRGMLVRKGKELGSDSMRSFFSSSAGPWPEDVEQLPQQMTEGRGTGRSQGRGQGRGRGAVR